MHRSDARSDADRAAPSDLSPDLQLLIERVSAAKRVEAAIGVKAYRRGSRPLCRPSLARRSAGLLLAMACIAVALWRVSLVDTGHQVVRERPASRPSSFASTM